jgi:hypothetical protein
MLIYSSYNWQLDAINKDIIIYNGPRTLSPDSNRREEINSE